MRNRRFLLGGTSVLAALVAWQTIQAVGSHVPIEERRWVPPTAAAGMDDGLMLAGHSSGPAGALPHFDVTMEADGVTAHPRPSAATVDLSALRYFAEQGDEAAMAREIARVERMNPGFVVPDMLRRPRDGTAEEKLWSLLQEGQLDAARARIEALEKAEEAYAPSPDFVAALEVGEARAAIESAHADERWADVITAAQTAPHALVCADAETLWRLAEGYAQTSATARALAVHAYVLTHCRDGDVREGSIARAVEVSPAGTQEVIVPIVARGPARDGEANKVRRAVARALEGTLRTERGEEVPWEEHDPHHDVPEAEREVARHIVVPLDLGALGGSALTDASIAVPKDRSDEQMTGSEIPVTYVPARNTVFLSIALGWAEVLGAHDLFIGVNALDYSGYPDCRPAFVDAFEALANVATREGVEGRPFKVHAPLIAMTKADIVRKGLALGVDYGLTHSCYDPDPTSTPPGRPCGQCDACVLRARGFGEAGATDPALARWSS